MFVAFAIVTHAGQVRLAALAGIVISSVLILSNVWPRTSARTRLRYFVALLLVYTAGVLVMGLRQRDHWHDRRSGPAALLVLENPSWYDGAINVIGFIPLGFLLGVVSEERRWFAGRLQRVLWPFLSCAALSLAIEVTQYFLRGRSSSLIDVGTNAAGALAGVVYALIFVRLWRAGDQSDAL